MENMQDRGVGMIHIESVLARMVAIEVQRSVTGTGWTFLDKKGGYAGSSSGPSDRNPFGDNED